MSVASVEDYKIAFSNEKLLKCPEFAGGHVHRSSVAGDPILCTGGCCAVFKFAKANGRDCAVRCWTNSDMDKIEERTRKISSVLSGLNSPYFVSFKYYENAIVANGEKRPVVIMDWVDSLDLREYVDAHLADRAALDRLAASFLQMAKDLHRMKISHGDLQYGNIMVRNDGSIVLIDYDSMFVPGLEGYPDDIKGRQGYQHPARGKNKYMSLKSDHFSELIIYSGILMFRDHPELWSRLNMKEQEIFLLSVEEISNPSSSKMLSQMCSDPNPLIKKLGNAIRTSLSYSTIDDIPTLESVVEEPVHRLAVPPGISLVKIQPSTGPSNSANQVNSGVKKAACIIAVCCVVVAGAVISLLNKPDSAPTETVAPPPALTEEFLVLAANDDRLTGTYTLKGPDGIIHTAEIAKNGRANSILLTIYGRSAPERLMLEFDDNSKIFSEKIGTGFAVFDKKSNAVRILTDNGDNHFELVRYVR